MQQRLELDVTGMTCGGCAASVERAVRRVAPAARVEVDLATGRVTVEGDLSDDQARQAIEQAGFGVTASAPG